MNTYPIALELTVWYDLGLNQYEIVIDEVSKISIKRTDDVLHTRNLSGAEVERLLENINSIQVPVAQQLDVNHSNKPTSSYELIIESAHFSLEFNWESVDVESSSTGTFDTLVKLASLVQSLDQDH